jgi:hypothetical protein
MLAKARHPTDSSRATGLPDASQARFGLSANHTAVRRHKNLLFPNGYRPTQTMNTNSGST